MKFLNHILAIFFKFFTTDEIYIKFRNNKYRLEINYREINKILESENINVRPEIKFLHPIFRILPCLGGIISNELILLNPFSLSYYIRYIFAKDKDNFFQKTLTDTIKHELHHLKQSQEKLSRTGSLPTSMITFVFLYIFFSFLGIQEIIKIIFSSLGYFIAYWLYPDEKEARKYSQIDSAIGIQYFKIININKGI